MGIEEFDAVLLAQIQHPLADLDHVRQRRNVQHDFALGIGAIRMAGGTMVSNPCSQFSHRL